MDWYLMAWRKYAEFGGRSRRSELWMFVLINFLVILALAALGGAGIAISHDIGGVLFVPLIIYVLAVIIPGFSVSVRRLHDSGKSGWLLLLFVAIGIIPIIGFISNVVQIVVMCLDSDPGLNQYGPNPKFPAQFGMASGYGGIASMGLGQQPPPFTTFTAENNFAFCRNCGTKLQNVSPFCTQCGTHV